MGSEDGGLREPAVAVADVREQDGAVVVALSGELDLHNAADVRGGVERAAASRPGRIVVDLAAVEFVDSTVIGVLVEANKNAGAGGLRLAAPSAELRRAFATAGVDSYLSIYESLDEALRA